ncbi:MAG: FliH/SctL family protein [Phycisphaerae bacterium]
MKPLVLNFGKRIEKALVVSNASGKTASVNNSAMTAAEQDDLEQQKNELNQLCKALTSVVETLDKYLDKTFAEYSRDIARLSVEIARKVLEQRVRDNDYEIESIIHQALDGLTVKQDIVVRLNPQDHQRIEQLLKSSQLPEFHGLAFVPDENIQPAECVLQTPQGTIELLIDEKLQRITEALTKTE